MKVYKNKDSKLPDGKNKMFSLERGRKIKIVRSDASKAKLAKKKNA